MALKRRRQIINPLVGFGQRAIGPYANRISGDAHAKTFSLGKKCFLSGDSSTFDTGLGDWINGDITRGDLTWNSGNQSLRLTNASGKLAFARAAIAMDLKGGTEYTYDMTWTVTAGTAAMATADSPSGPATNIRPSADDGTYIGTFTPSIDQSYLIFYINSGNPDDRTADLDNVQICEA